MWVPDNYEHNEKIPPETVGWKRHGSLRKSLFPKNKGKESNALFRDNTEILKRSASFDINNVKNMFKVVVEENINNIFSYATKLKNHVDKIQYQKQLPVFQVRDQTVFSLVLYNK